MPFATNALDGTRVHFEDDGGDGAPVVLHGGIVDSVDLVRQSNIAEALQELPEEFRLIYVAHRAASDAVTSLTRWRHMPCPCVWRTW